jgi:hypothetical protein
MYFASFASCLLVAWSAEETRIVKRFMGSAFPKGEKMKELANLLPTRTTAQIRSKIQSMAAKKS